MSFLYYAFIINKLAGLKVEYAGIEYHVPVNGRSFSITDEITIFTDEVKKRSTFIQNGRILTIR